MKVETGSFSANSSSVTVLLNDSTLNVKGIFFQVSPSSIGSVKMDGFTDGTTNRSGTPRNTSHCIYFYVGTTLKLAGKAAAGGLATAGEFTLDFDTFNAAYPVDFMVIGD